MISSSLEILLSPLIAVMRLMFEGFLWVSGSAGWSIVMLSTVIAILTLPLRKYAQHLEVRVRKRKLLVDSEIVQVTAGLKGEDRFRAVERVYESHCYHPIQNVVTGASLFVMLPFLLSALYLFSAKSMLNGEDFLFIRDLSTQDRLAWGVNVLPVIMTAVTLIDARFRFVGDPRAFVQFLLIAIVMFALVYSFNAGIVLYWTVSNLAAMVIYVVGRSMAPTAKGVQNTDASS